MNMDYKKYIILIIVALSLCISCGYYSFGGSIPSDITKISIPLFDDNTSYPGVREDLTNGVIDAFIANNTLQVSSETESDLLLTGTIVSISERAAIVKAGETVNQFEVYVNVRVKCEELKTGKVWWEKSLRRFGTMEGQASQDERDQAIAVAIEELTVDILDNTLASW
jgi:hypothetical protein